MEMKFRYWRVTVLAVVMVLLAPMAAIAAEQTVDVSVLPAGTLAIDVENDFGLGVAVLGEMTPEYWFHINITNTTATGFEVSVESTDLTSFYYDNCDDYGCDRFDTDPLYTMGADNIYMRGGFEEWDDPNQLTFYEGYLTAADTAFLLLEGTDAVYGSLGINNPQPSIQVDVPSGQVVADYWATLTYTVMAP
jgi:hypothetical protein